MGVVLNTSLGRRQDSRRLLGSVRKPEGGDRGCTGEGESEGVGLVGVGFEGVTGVEGAGFVVVAGV